MIKILSFYKIKKTNKLNILKKILLDEIIKNEIKGLLIISKEGINGTLAGKPSNITKISKFIDQLLNLKNLILKIQHQQNLFLS